MRVPNLIFALALVLGTGAFAVGQNAGSSPPPPSPRTPVPSVEAVVVSPPDTQTSTLQDATAPALARGETASHAQETQQSPALTVTAERVPAVAEQGAISEPNTAPTQNSNSQAENNLPSTGSALPLLSVIGFGVLVGGIASALKTR